MYYIFVLIFLFIVWFFRYDIVYMYLILYLGEKLLCSFWGSFAEKNIFLYMRNMFFFGSGLHIVVKKSTEYNAEYNVWKWYPWLLEIKQNVFFRFYIFLYCVIFMLRGIIRMFSENILYCIKYTICNKSINLDLKYD